jgi:NAD(P)-dependent dehydrogenase (short-subunit alcohol dehydrogenase family)
MAIPTRDPQITSEPTPKFPEQHQPQPGLESKITPRPRYDAPRYRPAGKLEGKAALITGGDSGIGRAVAVLYAREGADVAIVYLPAEQSDADETAQAVREEGRQCVQIPGDLSDPSFCREAVERAARELGRLDILVSNAAHQSRKESIEDITDEEWDHTFAVNVGAYFRLARAAVAYMPPGSAIIATSSETALLGSEKLLDYSGTKGAINAFTRSLGQALIDRGIRVNAVAPGPVWTPLNVADPGNSPQKVAEFGQKQMIGRPAQPEEIAPAYVFLASDADSSYITGIVLEQLGGEASGR